MKLRRSLALSWRALGAHRLRSTLALVGLSIGIAAVISVRAVGDGARREAIATIERMGANLLIVQAAKTRTEAGRARQTALATTMVLDDWRAIADECRSVAAAAPAQDRSFEVKHGDTLTQTMVLGSTADYVRVSNSELDTGRVFTQEETDGAARVAVLGSQVARNLFAGADPVGETIRVGRIPFVVVGVLREKGAGLGGSNEDDKILIPISTALRRVFNLDHIKAVLVSARRREDMDEAAGEVVAVLRERHDLDRRGRPDDFTIQSQATALAAAESTSSSFTTMVVAVGTVSLGVGGVGILALMLLAVRERTPEIGLRIAVGARPGDITVQFLSEAAMLGLSGGLAGTALGVAAAAVLGRVTEWQTAIEPGPAAFAILLSLGIGLLFGIYPAKRAASLDPIVALRAE